jgi:hypothetical protein
VLFVRQFKSEIVFLLLQSGYGFSATTVKNVAEMFHQKPVSEFGMCKPIQLKSSPNTLSIFLYAHKPFTLDTVENLCAKAERFLLIHQHPETDRTSIMIDRYIEPMVR